MHPEMCEFGVEEDQEWLTLCSEEVSAAEPEPLL